MSVMGMTNKMIMKWKCFVRLSNFPTNSVRKQCIEIIRENLWMWILGLMWVKLHLESNSPWHCLFAPWMGIEAVYLLDFFTDRHHLHSLLTAGLIWRWWCECDWLLCWKTSWKVKPVRLTSNESNLSCNKLGCCKFRKVAAETRR